MFEIIHLLKDQWKGTLIPIEYTTDEYYDLLRETSDSGFVLTITKMKTREPIHHHPAEYNYPDKLYQDHYEGAFAWGVLEDGKLIAAIETCPEAWSNRLRITELWVHPSYQKKGLGHRLIEVAKEQARIERRRAIILETQSCNVNAIDFYRHEGFKLIGLDTCAYSNRDLDKKEVRLEFGYLLEKKEPLSRQDLVIRPIEEEDWPEVYQMTQDAFWNKYRPGCDEHLLVYKLKDDPVYLPEISRIALLDGKVVGLIQYSLSKVVEGEGTDSVAHQVISFGPLCVAPDWQGCGIGAYLLKETMDLAKKAGYKAIIILGETDYYPRLGFKTCDHYGITTSDGKNFDAFMAYELEDGYLDGISGKYHYGEVFEQLPPEEIEAFNKTLRPRIKYKLPQQMWT